MFAVAISLLLLPLLFMCVDLLPPIRARTRAERHGEPPPPLEDFEVLVPIYGDLRYLTNVSYLADYGKRVLLCTTTQETAQFNEQLDAIAHAHGFRVFRGDVGRAVGKGGKRATGGTVRDRLIRDALAVVEAPYVVCLDADTETTRPLGELVAEMADRELDLASVRLVPSNRGSAVARLQAHEYRMAMRLRLVLPWLVSGACHAARTVAHREVMSRHSLFFQGNDVETGVLADALGYRVGHIPFEVPTAVPERWSAWLRQRLAWAGGEFRLFIVNLHLARKHPLFWCYGAIIVIVGTPFRWLCVAHPGMVLAIIAILYVFVGLYLHWEHRDKWLMAMPLYAAFSSLILTPLGVIWYVRMAMADRNAGLIRINAG
jgi:cellulose synthase/poly-beta-1,6-N-acetylglucosamine synthase-like glycosyltransferase